MESSYQFALISSASSLHASRLCRAHLMTNFKRSPGSQNGRAQVERGSGIGLKLSALSRNRIHVRPAVPELLSSETRGAAVLLRPALLLLSDADLEVGLLGFLEGLVGVARHDISQVSIHVGALGLNYHHAELFIAPRPAPPEPFDVGNCHNKSRIARGRRLL